MIIKNRYENHYASMHLCEHTYETEKALQSRRLASRSLLEQHDAELRLNALERAWQKQTGKLKDRCLNRDAIDTPTESMIEAEKPKKKRKSK